MHLKYLRTAMLPILATGCMFGAKASNYPMAHQPNGSPVQIRTLTDVGLRGELLAVSDTAMTIVSVGINTKRITLVPFRQIRRAVFSLAQSASFRRGSVPQIRKLQNISRYPQGISSDLMRRLLEAYGQSTVDVARP